MSTYKVNATGHKDMIVVKAKVATDVAGEAWAYSIADNGTTIVFGDGTTSKSIAKLVVRQSMPNLEGTDTIDFTATDSATGETCVAQVVYEG